MNPVAVDPALVAYCGLYCGACRAFRHGRCPACRANNQARWCNVRICCIANGFASCASCGGHPDPRTCGTYGSWVSRAFGFVFRSNRAAGIDRIRLVGSDAYAHEMALSQRPSPPR
ncbi:MAG TPA: DUF3795 domain-containing protein [Opitutaceae bacterium]|nr:DUF3795 domain-containing protein [Opitutaceae bacterium]